MTTNQTLRWGILGTATISRKNWHAILQAPSATLTGVASRSLEKAQSFIQDCQKRVPFEQAPKAFGSYEELLASPEVDAVYIPLPTGLRAEWVVRAAQAGKHVLCEKPCASSLADLEKMVNACRAAKVQFMDGVMFMHSDRLRLAREVMTGRQGIGSLRRLSSGFSFLANSEFLEGNIRMHSNLEPFGCLGDLGWYCIRFFLWAMEGQVPVKVVGRFLEQKGRPDSPDAVPLEFTGELFYKGGVSAGFYCSFLAENQQWVVLSGTEGNLTISDFVLPYMGNELTFEVRRDRFQVRGCMFNMEGFNHRYGVAEHSNNAPNSQETRMIENFSRQALSGELNEEWPTLALKTQKVMDACLASARQGAIELNLS